MTPDARVERLEQIRVSAAFDLIEQASRPEQVFGPNATLADVKRLYRELARRVHPDALVVEEREDGARAFTRLTKLFEAAKRSLANGTYGTPMAAPVEPIVIRTKRRQYKVTEGFAAGDASNLYRMSYTDSDGEPRDGVLKVVRDPRDNDLLQNEAKRLKAILSNKATADLADPYLPRFIETFGYRKAGERKLRQATAFTLFDKPLFTLADLRRMYAPSPLMPRARGTAYAFDPRDMAWICRRVLFALGLAHQNDIVHGAVLPEHLLIQPEQHGLVLVDWKYSVQSGERMRAIPSRFRAWYPDEVVEKRSVLPGTDIYMAMRLMVWLVGGDARTGECPDQVPRRLRMFFKGSTQASVGMRPQDAYGLLDEFDEALERLYGPKRFRPFPMSGVA